MSSNSWKLLVIKLWKVSNILSPSPDNRYCFCRRNYSFRRADRFSIMAQFCRDSTIWCKNLCRDSKIQISVFNFFSHSPFHTLPNLSLSPFLPFFVHLFIPSFLPFFSLAYLVVGCKCNKIRIIFFSSCYSNNIDSLQVPSHLFIPLFSFAASIPTTTTTIDKQAFGFRVHSSLESVLMERVLFYVFLFSTRWRVTVSISKTQRILMPSFPASGPLPFFTGVLLYPPSSTLVMMKTSKTLDFELCSL